MRAPDGIEIEIDLPRFTWDGTVLSADAYHPRGPGTLPALACRTLCDTDLPLYVDQGGSLAEAGFYVVIQDMRGRHASDGEEIALVAQTSCTDSDLPKVEMWRDGSKQVRLGSDRGFPVHNHGEALAARFVDSPARGSRQEAKW